MRIKHIKRSHARTKHPLRSTGRTKRLLAADLLGQARGPRMPAIAHKPPSANAIRALRQYLGLTQTAFSRQLGTTKMVISTWERGTRAPGPDLSARLGQLAEMNHLDLMKMSDPDYVNPDLELHVFQGDRPATGTQLASAFFSGAVK